MKKTFTNISIAVYFFAFLYAVAGGLSLKAQWFDSIGNFLRFSLFIFLIGLGCFFWGLEIDLGNEKEANNELKAVENSDVDTLD